MTPTPIHPLPTRCVRCHYAMDGVTNTARVCSECGLDNSGGNLALLAQRIRRESLVARWTVWGGAIGAFACFASAKRLAEHWSYYAGTRSKLPHWLDEALMVAMILCIGASSVGLARWMTVRSRVVRGRRAYGRMLLGALLGIAVGSASIVLVWLLAMVPWGP